MSTLNIIVLGGERNLIEKLFPKVKENNKEKREIRYFQNQNNSFYWRASIFPELNEENKKDIRNELNEYFGKEEKGIKKNVLLFFGDNGVKTIINIINKIEQTKRPLILIISNIKGDYSKLSEIRLLTFLLRDNDEEKTYNKIISYLWEKDCYFNEKGNSSCKLSYANLFYKKPKGFTFLKILLIGLKRSGKSTLINIVSKKFTAFELPNDQSVTKKITEYEVYPFENEEKFNISSIKFYDSPGIEKTDSFNSEKIVIDFLEKKFNEINLIYFLKRDGAIEDCKKVFEKIINLNNKRKKKNLPKVPIIFIINGVINVQGEQTSVAINTIKDYLKNNFGNELYEENKKQQKDELDSDDDDEENNNKLYEDGNIIRVNLRKQEEKFCYQYIYGINTLFAKSLEYLKITNSLDNNDLSELRKINIQLINLFKEKEKGIKYNKKEYNILINKSKEITSKMMKENSLLMAIPLLHNYYDNTISIVLIVCGAMFSFLLFGIPVLIAGIVLLAIGSINQIALEYGFDENDIKEYGLKEYILPELKDCNEKEIIKKIENAKDFFEKIIKFTNGSQLFIKSVEIYQNVFKSLEIFQNTNNEEWGRFTENEI